MYVIDLYDGKITASWLEQLNACTTQVRAFKRVFPDGAELTEENIHKAAAAQLNLLWLLPCLGLRPVFRLRAYNSLYAEYIATLRAAQKKAALAPSEALQRRYVRERRVAARVFQEAITEMAIRSLLRHIRRQARQVAKETTTTHHRVSDVHHCQ